MACYRKSGEPLPTMSAERSFLLINETWASATFGPSKPDYFVRTETAPDLRIAIHNPLSCHMSATLMLTRKWSGPGLDLLRRLVELEREHSSSDDESATLVVDVGANLGTYSLFAAMLGLRVVAFEPLQARRSLCPFRRQSLRCVLLRVGKVGSCR